MGGSIISSILSGSGQESKGHFRYPFKPWVLIPSTSYFRKKKKMIRMGIRESTDMAKVAP